METVTKSVWHVVLTGLFTTLLASCSQLSPPPAASRGQNDRYDGGANFEQVLAVLRSSPYDPAKLPLHTTRIEDVASAQMLADAGRTLDASVDLREPFQRILHPNGVCLVGDWIIDRPNTYSGVFKPGSRFPIIARVSPPNAGVTTHRLQSQSVGLVGKIFPSTDRAANVKTANFITQTDLGGFLPRQSRVLDSRVVMSNAPGVTAVRRGFELAAFGIQGNALDRVDLMTTQRQLYQLAEAGKAGEATRTPRFMKLSLDPRDDRPDAGEAQDLRLEFWRRLADGRPLNYHISVSDAGEIVGPAFLQRSWIHWNQPPIGRIEFHEAILSGACDHQVHFQHPAWRDRVDDPNSTVRLQHGAGFGQPLLRDQVVLHGHLTTTYNVSTVFRELDDVPGWTAWAAKDLIQRVRPGDGNNGLEVTFSVAGEHWSSHCLHESATDAAVSLSCKGNDGWNSSPTQPHEHDLTFLLTGLPDGRTRIDWGLLIHSKRAVELRNSVEIGIQTALEKKFPPS